MLNAMRKRAGSWIVKALLLLLVLSFAIWGIGDVFYGGARNPTVATVGGSEISASELATAFNQSLNNLQRQLGSQIDRERAIQLGLMQQTLRDLVARRLIDLRARDMGITVADDTLRDLITQNPTFQTGGQFDRSRFEQLLRANGLTEDGYLAILRQDVMRSTLTGSLAGPLSAPGILVDALYRHRNEQRSGRYLAIDPASVTDLPRPSAEELQAYHDAHAERFTAPEFRKITFITLAPEDLSDEVQVSEEQVEAEYQARIAQYRTSEQRTVEQLLATDRAALEQAAERVAEGASFAEAAEALAEQGVVADDLGVVARGGLPAELESAIFALGEGEVSAVTESPFGWHLFRVTDVEPETVTPLADVRDALREELQLAEARDRLPAFANQLDDELAAGQPLPEAAAALGLQTETLDAVDRQGRDPAGETPEALPSWPELLTVAFETPAGETSLLEETDAGTYFVVQVDEVQPPRVKLVEEVQAELTEAWQAEQRGELARERAEKLLARLRDGLTLEALADEAGATVQPIAPVKRVDQGL
jgi:peptidyl-prolyl cis-trans isomerase D